MHAPISAVFSLFSFYHVFSFSLSVLFCSQFLTIFFLWVLLPLGKSSPTIFGLLWASLQDCPPTHWLSDHYHYQVNSIHSLSFTTHSMTKSLFICSCCIPIFGKIPFQQGIFPKKATAENQIQTPFPLTTKPHLLNPLIVGPPPLYWLYIGWQCSGPYVPTPLSSVFVFFYSYAVSAVADWFCFVLLHVSSARVYPLQRRVCALGLALFSFVFSLILYSFSFTHFLLLTHFAIPCFFSSCLFILVFTPVLLYKKIQAFVGQIVFTRSKGIRPNWSYSAKVILLKNYILLQICILLQITFLAFLSQPRRKSRLRILRILIKNFI